jgi:glutathione S-transferase
MSDAPALTLHYFPFPGRAGAIRDTLRIGRVPFEDRHVSREEHADRKSKGEWPWGALPVLDVGSGAGRRRICQSNAILRYAGRLSGLYPNDPIEALKVDEALDALDDLFAPLGPTFRETDEARKTAMRKEMADVSLPRDFGRLEQMIKAQGSGYLAGRSLTVADLKALHQINKLTDGSLDHIPPSVIDPFPTLKAWREKVRAERDRRLEGSSAALTS